MYQSPFYFDESRHITTIIRSFTSSLDERAALELQAKALRDLPTHPTVNN